MALRSLVTKVADKVHDARAGQHRNERRRGNRCICLRFALALMHLNA
ncbi:MULTISPECIES: hypothetical protein [Silvimonas]|nr:MULTISPECIES: hypothetical protein [Silvimonas]MDR3429621.1 hypothetical protein [Silvimonas sp.]